MDNGENYQNKVCLKPDLLGLQKCTRKPYFCSLEDHVSYWACFHKSDLSLIWTCKQSKKIFALPIANFRRNEQILIKKKNLFWMRFHEILMHIFEKIRGKLTMFPKKGDFFFFTPKRAKTFWVIKFSHFYCFKNYLWRYFGRR